jgi:hypothetical protein
MNPSLWYPKSMWVVDFDIFGPSYHFRNSGFRSPKCKPKSLADQVPEMRKEVSCVKSKSEEFSNSELWSLGFRKS